MKKTLKRILAVVLVVCAIMSYTVPAANAAWWDDLFGGGSSSNTVTTYNFALYSDYKDVPVVTDAYGKEQKYVFHQALLGAGAKDSIPVRYASGNLNWTFEACSEDLAYGSGAAANLPDAFSRFASSYGLRSTVPEGEWMAFRFKSPGEGAHYLNLTYYSWASSPNSCAFYIFEAEGDASIADADLIDRQETIGASLHPSNRLGTLKMNSGESGAQMSAVIGNYTFAKDAEYVLVIENIEESTTSGSAYVALNKVEIAPGEKDTDSDTTSNDIRPIVAQKNAVPATDNGGMAAVWEVDGQDYYFLPLEGSKMAIFNLDTWQHIDTVDTGLYRPNSTTVTEDGKLIVGGDSRRMYVFDINTMRGKRTADFRTAPGFENESMVETVYAADNRYIYFGTSFGGTMACYDLETLTFENFGDIIDPSVRKAYGITTDSTDKGDTEGNVQGIVVHNGYFYAKAYSANYVIIVKYDLANRQLVGAIDVTKQLGSIKTQGGLFVLGNEYLLGTGSGDATMALIDLENWKLVEENDTNYKSLFKTTAAKEAWSNGAQGAVTGEVGGKQFFFINNGGLFYYELSTKQIKRLNKGASSKFNITGKSTVTIALNGAATETEYLISFASGGEPRFFKPSVGAKLSAREKLMNAEYAGGGSAIGVHELNGTNIYIGAWNNYAAAVYDTSLEKISQRYYTAGQTDSQLYYNGQLYAGNYSAAVVTKVNMDVEEQTEFVIQDIKKYEQLRIHTLAAGNDHIFCGTIPHYTSWGGAVAAYDINANEQSLLSFRCQAVSDEKTIGCTGATTGTHHPLCNLAVNGIVYEETNDVVMGATTRNGGTSVKYYDGTSAQIFVLDYQNMEILATLDLRNAGLGLQTDVIDYIGGLTIDPNVPGRVWGIVSDVLFYFTYNKAAGTFAVTKVLDLGSSSYSTSGNVSLHNREVAFDIANKKMYVAFFSNGMQCITVDDWDTPAVVSNEKFLPETPEKYVLSTDKAGKTSLYYQSGNDLMAYPVNVDDEDWATAAEVDEQIAAIGTVSADKVDDITAARAAYEALSLRHRALVQNYLKLTESEALVLEMQITNLMEQPTINNLAAMSDLMVKYNGMTDTQKSYVRNYDALVDTYDTVLDVAQNTNAGAVQDAINELTDITRRDEEEVIAARAAYDALTEDQKQYVDSAALTAAEAKLDELKNAGVQEAITYSFDVYNDDNFKNGCTKYYKDGSYTENFNASKSYDGSISIEQWFLNNFGQNINWGIETSGGNSGNSQDYSFRAKADQGTRLLAYEIGQYVSLRICVPAAGTYTVALQAGNVKSTSDIYIFEAATNYATQRTSTDTIVANMTEENLLADNLALAVDEEKALGQWTFDAAGEYILVFKAAATSTQGISLRKMTLSAIVDAEEAIAEVDGVYFTSLNAAMDHQVANGAESVKLTCNVWEEDLVFPTNAVLDLNGYTLTADSILTYSSNDVIDSSEKDTGVLKINDADGNMLSEDNSQLPIYDAAAGGLRFFEVSVKSATTTGKGGENPKYWFQVSAVNFDEIHKLIKAGSELNITVKMTWNGGELDAVAGVDFLNKWADAFANNESIYITVSAVNTESLEDFSLIPAMAANGVTICGSEM